MLQELELTDEQIKNIAGGCAGHPGGWGFGHGWGFGGHHWGYGGYGFGGSYGYGAPYGFGYGYPVAVVEPQVTAVQTTTCQQGVALALI